MHGNNFWPGTQNLNLGTCTNFFGYVICDYTSCFCQVDGRRILFRVLLLARPCYLGTAKNVPAIRFCCGKRRQIAWAKCFAAFFKYMAAFNRVKRILAWVMYLWRRKN